MHRRLTALTDCTDHDLGQARTRRIITQSEAVGAFSAKGWTREESFASIFSIKDQIFKILTSAAIPVSSRNCGSPGSSQGQMSSYPLEWRFVIA
jgi:hypothetical protein